MSTETAGIMGPLESECGAWALERLTDDVVGWLVTLAPNGRVQASAISFLEDGATILFYREPETPIRNIAAHPQVSFNLNSDQYADHVLVIEDTESARSWPMQNPRQVVRGTAAAMPAVRLRQAIADHRAAHFCDCDHREVKRGRSNETPSAYWTACTTAACLGTAAHFTNG